MAVPCVGSPTGCLGSPASCCSGRRCSTPPMTSGQRRSPEPPPKATRLDPLHPTKNSGHVAEHWSLIPGRKSHQARVFWVRHIERGSAPVCGSCGAPWSVWERRLTITGNRARERGRAGGRTYHRLHLLSNGTWPASAGISLGGNGKPLGARRVASEGLLRGSPRENADRDGTMIARAG